MAAATDAYQKCLRMARILLEGKPPPSPAEIREAVATAATTLAGATVDLEAVAKELESLFSVSVGYWTALDDPKDHIAWLPDKQAQIQWKFWRRYQEYLEEYKNWAPAVVNQVDRLTDDVLGRLEDPARPPTWDRRGMVVGSVQSGKTANYIGLVCKALDAGYKLVIVLAGMHKSLRSQTQLRVDEGVLGFDTQKNRKFDQSNQRIGVGLVLSEPLYVHSLTNSADNGDFNSTVANQVGVMIGGNPVVLVVKKNKTVLGNLIKWAVSVAGQDDEATGQKIIKNVPLLLIDDEADHASINTKAIPVGPDGGNPEDYDVTAINEKIREILRKFDKSAYVGYTATPFANIFVDPCCATERLGDDIFPRSFIINLRAPSNYVGPSTVFGVDGDPDAGIEDSDPLPLIRTVADYADCFPIGHKKTLAVPGLPPSLSQSIRAFVIACAARRARGQTSSHNSMLIHVTRFVDVQSQVAELVREELAALRRRIEYGDGNSPTPVANELRSLWETDFVPTTLEMEDSSYSPVTWDQVEPQLLDAVAPIEVKEINGTARDVLDYYEHPNGRSVIAIGGDKLSRGLTLEGLSVSYFLRSTKMYDTLLQMGRWFGYRPGYLDLCRLYTPDELVQWYRHIALAEEELRREFDYMVSSMRTPQDYGLRVRTHPEGLLITALNKMRAGTVMRLSYSGRQAETGYFYTDLTTIQANREAAEELLRSQGDWVEGRARNLIWRQVAPEFIERFLEAYRVHPFCHKADTARLRDYIRAQKTNGELTEWTVALINNATGRAATVAGQTVGMTRRTNQSEDPAVYALPKSRILSPGDEYLDLDDAEVAAALAETVRLWKNNQIHGKNQPTQPNGAVVRERRPVQRGLLVLYPLDPSEIKRADAGPVFGFAFSFPKSETAREIEYKVNKIALDLEYADEDD